MALGEFIKMQQAERAKVLASEIAGLLIDVRVNLGVSRGLLNDIPASLASKRETVRLVIPEMGFFTWFVSGNLFHGDGLFGALHGLDLENLSSGVGVENVLSRVATEDQPQVAGGLRFAISSGQRCTLSYTTNPDNIQRDIILIGCCLRNEEGMPSFFSGIVIEKTAAVFLDGSDPFKAYCDAALSLAKERGNLLATRYLKSALNSAAT
ncbi:hypothetical protein RMS29_023370 [Agrobacterium rosae]|uniref:Uncharacterized protein n=2 Tax=Agrobacterium rosae TaxID=1972867 RepID=A0ABU4VYW3_9HYPH|nr:hypothetical protein [Agrobacterium rosae]KAA3509658.1 hypothetical protein DXM21_21605 [Agrobacterium rosae]MCM2435078.1 hypothetical protein [Agrobacterium rosae]MDX8330699.1 hypothetical protein [Agrobacterium rosae]MQB50364.1 hypothetical protein [Agrobacterium rosae]